MAQTREAGGWGGLSTVAEAGGGGASLKSMSHALTRSACETGQNHNGDTCGSRAGFLATRLGRGG